MENNIINEVTLIKKLMQINEAVIKFKFGLPKITKEIDALSDSDIKGWNLDIKKENPYRQGVMITEKIDTKAKLESELNELNNVSELTFLKKEQKEFLKQLNERLETINPKYVEELADSFKIDFKNADDVTRGKFLNSYKQLLDNNSYIRFEKRLEGISIKGVLPLLKYTFKGSINTAAFLLKNHFWKTALFLLAGPTLGAFYSLINKGQKILIDKIDEGSKAKGAKLFKLLLTEQNIFISALSSEEISKAYGITEENKIEIDNYAQNFYNTKSWFDTTEGEVKNLFKNITSNFDGINFIYFLSKFQELSGQSLLKFLREQEISNIDNIIFNEDSINPDFEFLTVMTSDVETLESINTVMNAMTESYGSEDGYSQIQIKQDSRNENSEWVPFNNPDSGITLNVINKDGQTVNFDYTTRIKILNDLKRYIDGVWSTTGSLKTIEYAKNLFKQIWEDKKVPSNDDLLKLSLDPKTVYTEVSTKLMEEHPKFSKIMFTWPWVQKMNENVVGLARILKEQPVLNTTKKTNTNQTKQNVLPSTPFKTQAEGDAFRAWVRQTDATYASQIKLDATGPFNNNTIKTAYQKYGNQYQQSLTSGGGAIQQQPAQDVDKAKEIFDKFNDSVFFDSVNNERMNIEYTQQIGKWIKYYSSKKFNEESSYLGSVLSAYGNMISKYKTDEEIQTKIDTQLPTLQTYLKTLFEGIQLKRRIGLSEILEQVSNLVTVNVVNRIPQKKTESDNYKDASGKYIKTVIGGGDEVRRGERSDTVVRIKKALGYTKDNTPFFTDDFYNFIIEYKGKNGLDNTNGNISQDLICSIEQYKKLCSTLSSQKTTAPVKQTQIPIEVKYLNDYTTAVGTGTPSEGPCNSLFIYYEKQAYNWDLGNKVGQPNTEITAELLKNTKTAVNRCRIGIKKKFDKKYLKYILDKNNPFYISEFDKEKTIEPTYPQSPIKQNQDPTSGATSSIPTSDTTTTYGQTKKITDMTLLELVNFKKNSPLKYDVEYKKLKDIEKNMIDNKMKDFNEKNNK